MTAPQEEWTDWITHDGKGCPCVGQWVQCEVKGNRTGRIWIIEARAGSKGGHSWNWANKDTCSLVIRFRIRKPRALLDMIQLIADLPAPVAPIKTDGVIA